MELCLPDSVIERPPITPP